MKKRVIKRAMSILLVLSLIVSGFTPFKNIAAEEKVENLAFGKTVTANPDMADTEGLSRITDGNCNAGWINGYMYRTVQEVEDTTIKPYVTIDLGTSYDISQIKFIGVMPGDYPRYKNTPHNMVFRVSNDPNFEDESTKTVFNTDKSNFFGFGEGGDTEEESTDVGRIIEFEPTNARYVRYYQHGSTTLPTPGPNCWPNSLAVCEIEVYENEPDAIEVPVGNVAYGAKVTGSEYNSNGDATNGWWGGWNNYDLQEITNGQAGSDRWKAPANNLGGTEGESVYLTVDLKKAKTISTIKIWSKVGLTPNNQIVQVSEDGTNWVNVYNSDKDNKAEQDPSDSDKVVCGGKLQNGTITGVNAGTDELYQVGTSGKTIDFDKTEVRYIRWWSSGITNNDLPMMIQLQAFNRHVVTFDSNDGSGTTQIVNVDEGNVVSRPSNPISAELGKIFDKWTVDVEGGEEWNFSTPITDNLNLVANWKTVGFSTVTFDTLGGVAMEAIKVTNGLNLTRPQDPEKEGYVFAGWKLDDTPYDFTVPVTSDITLVATWVLPATTNAIVINAGMLNMVLDSYGNVTNLISTLDGTDYSTSDPDGNLRSLISLVANYNIETPTSLTYDKDENVITFGFASISAEAKVALKDNGNYTSLTLEEVTKPDSVSLQAVLWGPVKTTIKTGGQTVGTLYDDNYAIGMHMLNSKTVGGWPVEFKDDFYAPNLPPVNGNVDPRVTRNIYTNTAAFSTWGSTLQGYTWDYTKDTMRTVANYSEIPQLQPAMTGSYADELASMIGSSIALYGTRTDNILNVISHIELTEGLPHPTINGEWQKESIDTMQDFLVFNDSIWENVENDSKMANDAGIQHIYGQYGASGPWTSEGGFQFNGHFGGSDENAKAMVDEAAKYGVYIGTHTLSNLISYHDQYATPEATDMLSYAGFAPLTREISETDTKIYVKDGYPFSDTVVNASGGRRDIRIGKEMITYTSCSQVDESEWVLTGCVRGVNSTTATEHKADDNAYKLWYYYVGLVGGWESLDPITNRLGDIMNNVGIHSMSYDSFESTKYSVYSSLLEGKYMQNVYNNVKAAGNADGFITEASDMDSVVWDVHSRISWGESNTPINTMINYLSYYKQNFFPRMLGWSYDHGNHGGYSEPKLLMNLAMKGGWNAGTGWYVGKDTFKAYPHMPGLIKLWNNAIKKGAFVVGGEYTEEIQNELRAAWVNGKCWSLTEVIPDKEWSLQEVNKANLNEKIGTPITLHATNNIDVQRVANGDIATNVSLDYSRTHKDNIVTVSVQPYTDYKMVADSLKVVGTDKTNYELTPVEGEEGVYTFVMPEQDVTITAEFARDDEPTDPEPQPEYVTITFKGNGGIVSESSKTVEKGTVYGTLPAATRNGYDFIGWYNGSTQVKSTDICNRDVTLTAKWEKKTKPEPQPEYVIVTFDANGGNVSMSTMAVEKGKAYGTLPTATRNGYNFLGWYNGSTQVKSTDICKKDVTLVAKWEEIKADSKPVTKITLNETEKSVVKGTRFTLQAVVEPSTATNKNVKWTSSNTNVATVDANGKVTAKGNGKATIKATAADGSEVNASCEVTVAYKITYVMNKGENHESNPFIYYETKVSLKAPSRKGYTFEGWYTDKKFKNKISSISASSSKDITVYAKWEKIKVGKVTVKNLQSKVAGTMTVNYTKVNNVSGYEIVYGTDAKLTKDKKTITTKSSSVIIKKLKKGGTYYVKVRAYQKDSSGKNVYGAYSKVMKVQIKK